MVVGLNMLLWIPKAVDVLDVRLLGTPEKTVPTRMVNQGVMATKRLPNSSRWTRRPTLKGKGRARAPKNPRVLNPKAGQFPKLILG